jgi:hypothetical protein
VFPYQIYQALSDQHIRDMLADARRHELLADARRHQRTVAAAQQPTKLPAHSSPRKYTVAHLLALAHLRRGARAASTTTSSAGPMGCIA